MEQDFSFSIFNDFIIDGICQSLNKLNPKKLTPIFICVGSDLVLGDSLGPLIGTFLRKNGASSFVYGTLNSPITAKEVEYAKTYIKEMHPNCLVVAIDAAVGEQEDVGIVRVQNKGLKPGLGVNKKLGELGDISIIGVVASKSLQNYNLFNATRLNLVYKMSSLITSGISKYLELLNKPLLNPFCENKKIV